MTSFEERLLEAAKQARLEMSRLNTTELAAIVSKHRGSALFTTVSGLFNYSTLESPYSLEDKPKLSELPTSFKNVEFDLPALSTLKTRGQEKQDLSHAA